MRRICLLALLLGLAPGAAFAEAAAAPATAAATVILEAGPVHVHREGFGAAFGRFARAARARLGVAPRIDLVLREPVRDGAVYEHDDAALPVAGLATPTGSSGIWDLVLVLDASTSTREFAETDVNGDGRLEDRWDGPDSIHRAQLRAARDFVAELARLPRNRGGERIRVGVVRFAGRAPAAGETAAPAFEGSPAALLALAQRDAELAVPITSDYARLDRELEALADVPPEGMTDFAAGVGRALAALDVVRAGVAADGPRSLADKAIFFLSDGKPRLPGDRRSAERAALYASGLAGDAGVRIHTFALGRDVVRRDVNPLLDRMARRSGGRLTRLERPGEIVEALRAASFAFVSDVRIVNHSTGASSSVATGIDGSFFGEIPLGEGPNQLEIAAVLNDGRLATRQLTIDYVDTKPIKAMQRKLAQLREENAALLEGLRERLAQDIAATRDQQDRDLAVRAEAERSQR